MKKSTKLHIAAYSALTFAVIFCAVMWGRSYKRSRDLSLAVSNGYNKAFFELTDYVNNIDALLAKAQLAASGAELAAVSNEIFTQSAAAKACFGELPQGEVNLEHTARFLSQVGDYTYVLSQNMLGGGEISGEEYATLAKLNGYASELGKSLGKIEERIYAGELSFQTASAAIMTEALAADESIFADLENVEMSFEGYPSLIYDGPFSEHIESREPQMLKNAPIISQQAALKKARSILGKRGKGLKYDGETVNTAIETYDFTAESETGIVTISITKKGGYALYFLESRDVNEYNYDITAASNAALKFLDGIGITDMAESYYETKDNIATINFAYEQNGIKCYSDLVKVRVALDDGSIVGMESRGYLMNHRERDLSAVQLDAAAAQAFVSAQLDVSSVSLAVIPKDSMREVLCYEFKGEYACKNFLVYINAENGKEEDILLLIESATGVLTV